ncbi:MAG: caspase family protein [Deltaproteobacteria bacterium]|nr:caspase family protein [Deltaproteobacteria bacterium]
MRATLVALAVLTVDVASEMVRAEPAPDPAGSVDPAERTTASMLVGRRLALIVGSSEHDEPAAWPRLPNAVSDADALADELAARYGFEVTRLASPTMATFKTALRAIAAAAGPTDDVIVFVAGHGHFDAEDRAGYLVFRDSAAACRAGCYPLDNVKRALYDTRARHVLVMLDACYAGTFDIRIALDSGASRESPLAVPLRQSLRDYARYASRLVLASVDRAPTTDGQPGAHSPFMRSLLRALARPGPSGVVSLDRLYVSLAEDEALPVSRPTTFGSVVPSHPSGTFLFIEEVALCDALGALLDAGDAGFARARATEVAPEVYAWATVTPATWVLPGSRRCDVWDWPAGEDRHAEVRCDLGPYDRSMAPGKASDTFRALRQCVAAEPSEPADDRRGHGDIGYHDLRLALPSRGRALRVSTLCERPGDACTIAVIVE